MNRACLRSYLQPFPGPGSKIRISTAGGTQVRWRRDGKEIFYIAADTAFMAVPMDIAAGRSEVGTPVPLFKTRIAPIQAISRQQYVVAPDGQRFLISTSDETPTQPITLILNWKPALTREGHSDGCRSRNRSLSGLRTMRIAAIASSSMVNV